MTEQRNGLPVLMLSDGESFERWLEQQPKDTEGAWLKFAKKGAESPTLTKAEAIDAALCHGWIDGQLDKYDDEHWLVRFTPRKARSKWSEINKKRAAELLAEGRVRESGLAQIEAAKADGRWDAAYAPQSQASAPDDFLAALDENPRAKAFHATLNKANRYAIYYRIRTAKRPETRRARIAQIVAMLANHETPHPQLQTAPRD
jgi:uncharacterized protein YdeI (YjbR/CyaY-like superfamily)